MSANGSATSSTPSGRPPRVPPRWFVTTAWRVHRGLFRATPGTAMLRLPKPGGWGMMRVTTTGRRSGQERPVILAYIEDGENLVTMAMNGWGEGAPAWWLNLQANPDASVELKGGEVRQVRAHRPEGAEHDRLWELYRRVERDLDGYTAHRSTPTPLLVLTPRAA